MMLNKSNNGVATALNRTNNQVVEDEAEPAGGHALPAHPFRFARLEDEQPGRDMRQAAVKMGIAWIGFTAGRFR